MNTVNYVTQNNQIYGEQDKKLKKKMSFLGNAATDSIEIQNKNEELQEEKKENFLYSFLRRHGVQDPKKTVISAALTVATIIGLGFIGNKYASKTAELGIRFENKFLGDGSLYQKGANFIKGGIKKIGNFFKTNKFTKSFAADLTETFKNNKAKPVWNVTRGNGQDVCTQFEMTNLDIFKNALYDNKQLKLVEYANKNLNLDDKTANQICDAFDEGGLLSSIFKNSPLSKFMNSKNANKKAAGLICNMLEEGHSADDIIKSLENANIDKMQLDELQKAIPDIISKIQANKDSSIASMAKLVGPERAEEFYTKIIKGNENVSDINADLCSQIQKTQGINPDDKLGLKKFFDKMINDPEYADFQDIEMRTGGVNTAWQSVNWINNLLNKTGKGDSKLAKKIYKYTKAQAGDSMLKMTVSEGKMTKTLLGKIISGSLILPSESITNFVNEKTLAPLLFSVSALMQSYDKIQEAPKEKKFSTFIDEFVTSQTISWIISMPLAFKATYALATLGRLPESKNVLTNITRTVGKVFNIGLDPKSNPIAKTFGGVSRFFLIVFVFSSLFRKPIDAIMQKVFGKPYDKYEEEKKKQLETQANQVIPELGITQKELMEKIQKNPHALDSVQNDPEMTKKLQENPKLLLDLLDGKDVNTSNTSANKKSGLSEANMKYVQSQATKAQNARSTANTDLSAKNTTNMQSLNDNKNIGNSTNFFFNKDNKEEKEEQSYDTATYIPSSTFSAKSDVSKDLQKEIDAALKSSDKLLKKAEKIIA